MRDSKNSSSRSSFVCFGQRKLQLSMRGCDSTSSLFAALSAYPRLTKICRGGSDNNMAFARHREASRATSRSSESKAYVDSVAIPYCESFSVYGRLIALIVALTCSANMADEFAGLLPRTFSCSRSDFCSVKFSTCSFRARARERRPTL